MNCSKKGLAACRRPSFALGLLVCLPMVPLAGAVTARAQQPAAADKQRVCKERKEALAQHELEATRLSQQIAWKEQELETFRHPQQVDNQLAELAAQAKGLEKTIKDINLEERAVIESLQPILTALESYDKLGAKEAESTQAKAHVENLTDERDKLNEKLSGLLLKRVEKEKGLKKVRAQIVYLQDWKLDPQKANLSRHARTQVRRMEGELAQLRQQQTDVARQIALLRDSREGLKCAELER